MSEAYQKYLERVSVLFKEYEGKDEKTLIYQIVTDSVLLALQDEFSDKDWKMYFETDDYKKIEKLIDKFEGVDL